MSPKTTLRKRKADAYGIGLRPGYWAFGVEPDSSLVFALHLSADGEVTSYSERSTGAAAGVFTTNSWLPIPVDPSGLLGPGALAWSTTQFIAQPLAEPPVYVWDRASDQLHSWIHPSAGTLDLLQVTCPQLIGSSLYVVASYRPTSTSIKCELWQFDTRLGGATKISSSDPIDTAPNFPRGIDLTAGNPSALITDYVLTTVDNQDSGSRLQHLTVRAGLDESFATHVRPDHARFGRLFPRGAGSAGVGTPNGASYYWVTLSDAVDAELATPTFLGFFGGPWINAAQTLAVIGRYKGAGNNAELRTVDPASGAPITNFGEISHDTHRTDFNAACTEAA